LYLLQDEKLPPDELNKLLDSANMTDLISNHPKKIASLIKNNLAKKGAAGSGNTPSVDDTNMDLV
jgi:hypothetical protein